MKSSHLSALFTAVFILSGPTLAGCASISSPPPVHLRASPSVGDSVAFTLGDKGFPATVGLTTLEGFTAQGQAQITKTGDVLAITRMLADAHGRHAEVVDTFLPTATGIHWKTQIKSDDAPWTTPIRVSLRSTAPKTTKVWTSWVSPDPSKQPALAWRDPLVPMPFSDRTLMYGCPSGASSATAQALTLPLASFLSTSCDTGFSLVLSPDDVLLDEHLLLCADGTATWKREQHRIGGGRTVAFHADLVPHESDWRGGLRFMTATYPGSFEAPNPRAHAIAGCGAYATGEEAFDAGKLRQMAFGFNWKLSDDFPYMGMFIPPVKDADEKWTRSCDEASAAHVGPTTSCRRMNDYAKAMKKEGFAVLSYFNATEFGKHMNDRGQRKDERQAGDPELWKDPAGFVNHTFPEAILDRRIGTCYGAYVMDPGEANYQAFLLEQARRNCDLLPDTDGICIDRTDWLKFYNHHADDGVSMVGTDRTRNLNLSWAQFMGKLGPLMHSRDKLIFVNILSGRLDTLKGADGVYTEFGIFGNGDEINIAALPCLRKPAVLWTGNETLNQPDPDSFMQRHLHMGVFPTAPYPHNNHCINPEPKADALYLAYGPLLKAMKGRKWVLTPHCVETTTPGAKANLFEVPGGYALPLTFAGEAKEAVVTVRNIAGLRLLNAEAMLPGTEKPAQIKAQMKDDALELTVPLARGCAMVKLAPDGTYSR